uniref:ZP domain-containing protein n=1 Tax=Romanomermis culicivorax TaxID=13658 RepID=A0A915J5K2_ROMCU
MKWNRLRFNRFHKFALLYFKFVEICIAEIVIDNNLSGEPQVFCGFNDIEFTFETQNSFWGKAYIKGHYANPDCRIDYSDYKVVKSGGKMKIRHGSCDMTRQRMISPQGMQFSTVIVISFHPIFITKVDKAFNVKCTYREAAKMVVASLDVRDGWGSKARMVHNGECAQ